MEHAGSWLFKRFMHEPPYTKAGTATLFHCGGPRNPSHGPVLSTILAFQVVLGLLIGFLKGWSFGDAVYFTFITGLTIGYGDIVPRQAFARALAIGIGVSGLFLTGVIAGIAVYAVHAAIDDRDSG